MNSATSFITGKPTSGSEIRAKDLFKDLMPTLVQTRETEHQDKKTTNNDDTYLDAKSDFVLLWPPNLFAYTSTILSITGSYYVVVSNEDKNFDWPLNFKDYDELLKQNVPTSIATNSFNEVQVCYDCINPSKIVSSNDNEPCAAGGCKYTKDYNGDFEWTKQMQKIGRHWRYKIGLMSNRFVENLTHYELNDTDVIKIAEYVPDEVIRLWSLLKLWINENCSISSVDREFISTEYNIRFTPILVLLSLHAMSDESCAGWGISKIDKIGKRSEAQKYAENTLLKQYGTLALINPARARILPKRHTPNVGITLRSLSSHLGYHRSSVDINWLVANTNPVSKHIEADKSFSILLLPWPLSIRANDFKKISEVPGQKKHSRDSRSDNNYFVYNPVFMDEKMQTANNPENSWVNTTQYWEASLELILEEAKHEAGSVDMVIFPESSLDTKMAEKLQEILQRYEVSVYIFGVREEYRPATEDSLKSASKTNNFKNNVVYFDALCKKEDQQERNNEAKDIYVYSSTHSSNKLDKGEVRFRNDLFKQYKHHRWKITRSQVTQYGLGRVLRPSVNWWEGIHINQRKVSFINVGEQVTICPLICEDLARQDPIADLIRTVGPSLVITILMDGPQKADRWSAKYASVLADDPGSSVITLTSYGMVERWNQSAQVRSNAISLWNDGLAPAREIQMDRDAKAVLLSMCVEDKNEKVADGRSELYKTSFITLGGTYQIKISDERIRKAIKDKNEIEKQS